MNDYIIKTRVFERWKNYDYDFDDAAERVKRLRKSMMIWINNNNIDVVEIKENVYTGGRWVEEQRGATFRIYYKEKLTVRQMNRDKFLRNIRILTGKIK